MESRLFVALPAPEELKKAVTGLPRNGLHDGRWTIEDDLHLTVRFLGDLEEEKIATVVEALERIKRPPFYIEADGLSAFYNKNQTILFAHIASTRKLTALCTDITDILTPLGFDFGMRPYVPHITLARLKKNHPPRRKVEAYIDHNSRRIKQSWKASSFTLMKAAALEDSDRRYRPVREFPLRP